MDQRTSQIIYQYWNEVRGDRIAPARFEIQPGRISAILSETFILERTEGDEFNFRLAGTRICDQFGSELRGRSFVDLGGREHRRDLELDLRTIADRGAVGIFEIEASADREPEAWERPTSSRSSSVVFEVVVLPLVHSGGQITRFLGSATAVSPPTWLGTETLTATSLLRRQLRWPNGGTPAPLSDTFATQAPFLPSLENARVVRHQRRQFRVLDGGRSNT